MPKANSYTVGLDIGYGAVKAVTVETSLTFPSVCGYARDLKFQREELTVRHPGEQLQDDEGAWFVGELALTQVPTGELLRLRGRTADEAKQGNVFRARLAKTALGKLLQGQTGGDVVHMRLATGLPVDHMADAPALKSALLGQHAIQTDTTQCVVNVTEVMVMPQPYGTIYSQTLTPQGTVNAAHSYGRTGVLDVGTYTVDVALDDEGEFVAAESGSIEGGVSSVLDRLADHLEREHRQKIAPKLVESVLRTGRLKVRGTWIDYHEAVGAAIEPLRSATLYHLQDKWQAGTTVDILYLSGGGAVLVYEAVKAMYPQTVPVDAPQLANARGYLYYGLFTAQPAAVRR